MTQKELIRQEIERRKNICEGIFERESDTYYQGKAVAYGEILPFIDSLPEEHSFKPTQEQLNALDTVYKTHGADSTCRHVILNLLNQLRSI